MDELISRQVLDLWNRYKPTIAVDAMEYDRELKKLLSTNLAEVGTDCISRQEAIEALNRESRCGAVIDHCGLETAIDIISELPSAQPEQLKIDLSGYSKEDWERFRKELANIPMTVLPEQRTGHWILDRSGAYCCSECMEPCASYVMMKPRDKFCKMCGAKMEVTE